MSTLKGYFTINKDSATYPADTRYFSYNTVGTYYNVSEDTTQTVMFGVAYNLQVVASAKVKFTIKMGWTTEGMAVWAGRLTMSSLFIAATMLFSIFMFIF